MIRPARRLHAALPAAVLLCLLETGSAAASPAVLREAPPPPVALRTLAVLDRGTLERAGIRSPERLAYGADGTLHVLDAGSRRVVALDPQGRERFAAGGYGSDDASLSLPVDLALDRRGSLLVLDRGRGAVIAYDTAGRFLAARAIEGGALDEARSTGARLLADPFGNLWLLAPVSRDLIALDGRLRPSRVSRFLEPVDSLRSATLAVFLPSGEAWVFDADGGALRRFASDGRHARSAGSAERGGIAASDLAADASGSLFVADRDGQRVLVLDRGGVTVLERLLGGPSSPWRPTALAAGPGDLLAVADAGRDEIQILRILRVDEP
jgi:hypothetical protein